MPVFSIFSPRRIVRAIASFSPSPPNETSPSEISSVPACCSRSQVWSRNVRIVRWCWEISVVNFDWNVCILRKPFYIYSRQGEKKNEQWRKIIRRHWSNFHWSHQAGVCYSADLVAVPSSPDCPGYHCSFPVTAVFDFCFDFLSAPIVTRYDIRNLVLLWFDVFWRCAIVEKYNRHMRVMLWFDVFWRCAIVPFKDSRNSPKLWFDVFWRCAIVEVTLT